MAFNQAYSFFLQSSWADTHFTRAARGINHENLSSHLVKPRKPKLKLYRFQLDFPATNNI